MLIGIGRERGGQEQGRDAGQGRAQKRFEMGGSHDVSS
jgi:hypothetical protein